MPSATSIEQSMEPGALRSLLVNGVIGGVGSVLVFLPQILILFFFIAVLEDCGYMARAAYLMDRLMTRVGLSGKSFIPLLSSFACAVPGIMATRVIENRRDRLTTILVAPLMSCSARLPVYTILIAAFIPARSYAVWAGAAARTDAAGDVLRGHRHGRGRGVAAQAVAAARRHAAVRAGTAQLQVAGRRQRVIARCSSGLGFRLSGRHFDPGGGDRGVGRRLLSARQRRRSKAPFEALRAESRRPARSCGEGR